MIKTRFVSLVVYLIRERLALGYLVHASKNEEWGAIRIRYDKEFYLD